MASPVTIHDNEKTKVRILEREALPKYSFQGRKLDKNYDVKGMSKKNNQISSHQKDAPTGAVVQTGIANPGKSNISKPMAKSSTTPSRVQPFVNKSADISKPVNIVNPATSSLMSSLSLNTESLPPAAQNELAECQKNEARLAKEVESLKCQLEVQLQVNSELKRLLLASMGEDLEKNVERLARDKAQLTMELGDHVRKITSDYENLDKISIQADMWRSKFLASRVMIDELANAKAFYSLQYQESQDVLQMMLNERHEIRTNLLEAYKCLQQVKDAFDPLNSHQSCALPSTNTLDLAKLSQQLAEIIRYRLLPANVKVRGMASVELNWQDQLTPAENKAHEVISKNVSPIDYKYNMPQSLLSSTKGRYHPHTVYDNLTFNCCPHCKGEISVV